MDNIFLIRDIIDVCRSHNLDFGIVSLSRRRLLIGWITLISFLHLGLLVLVMVFWPGLVYCIVVLNVW